MSERQRRAAAQRSRYAAALYVISLLAIRQRIRLLESAMLSVVTCVAIFAPVVAALDEGQQYHYQTKGVSGHNLGPPHPHVVVRLCIAMAVAAGRACLETVGETGRALPLEPCTVSAIDHIDGTPAVIAVARYRLFFDGVLGAYAWQRLRDLRNMILSKATLPPFLSYFSLLKARQS